MVHVAKASTLARILATLVIGVVWAYVIVRTIPQAMSPGNGDYGFFTGVADRLRVGDALYVDVWDNKDPFLFYSIAIARTFGPAGAWILEIVWIAAASIAALFIAKAARIGPWMGAFLGLALTPLVILGLPYFMGTSHLPGIALTLASIASAMHRRFLLAGILMGALVFTKLIMMPVLLAALGVLIFRARDAGLRKSALTRLSIGFGIAVAIVALVMSLRGELLGFIETQLHNTFYSQSPIVSAEYTGLLQRVAQHIVILINPHVLAILLTTSLAGFVVLWHHRRVNQSLLRGLPSLWWMTALTFLAEVLVIMAAGKWLHHAEILVISSVLVLMLLASYFRQAWKVNSWGLALMLFAITWPLSGLPGLANYPEAFASAPRLWEKAQQVDPLTVILKEREPTTYALVGWGNLIPKSGMLEEWSLACRHVAQRPFNPQNIFDETIECLPSAQLVIVTNDYGFDPEFPAYNDFVSQVEVVLEEGYTCEQVPDFRICRRNA